MAGEAIPATHPKVEVESEPNRHSDSQKSRYKSPIRFQKHVLGIPMDGSAQAFGFWLIPGVPDDNWNDGTNHR